MPERAGNEDFSVQLIFHSISSMLMPHDTDFTKTKIIKYMTDAVPVRYIEFS